MLDPSQSKAYPQCINKKEARMVCLNETCNQYAFFCLQCEDESCEIIHRHHNKADKLMAVSFKEFTRRVLKERKPVEELSYALNTYRHTLERLRTDLNQFVEKELNRLSDIMMKATQVSEQLYPTVKKLREKKYAGLIGKQMDYLWKNCGESKESIKIQYQTAQFIKIKEEEIKAISEHFQNLNRMEIDRIEVYIQGKNPLPSRHIQKRGAPSPSLSNISDSHGHHKPSFYKE